MTLIGRLNFPFNQNLNVQKSFDCDRMKPECLIFYYKTLKRFLMRILGVLITIVSMLLTILSSFTPLDLGTTGGGLIDTTSFINVIGIVIGGCLMSYGVKLGTAFKKNSTKEDTVTAIGIYKLAFRVSIGSGFIGTVVGWIAMLKYMGGSNIDRGAFTGGAATSLITILYGLTFAFCLFLPLQYYFQSELDKDS